MCVYLAFHCFVLHCFRAHCTLMLEAYKGSCRIQTEWNLLKHLNEWRYGKQIQLVYFGLHPPLVRSGNCFMKQISQHTNYIYAVYLSPQRDWRNTFVNLERWRSVWWCGIRLRRDRGEGGVRSSVPYHRSALSTPLPFVYLFFLTRF